MQQEKAVFMLAWDGPLNIKRKRETNMPFIRIQGLRGLVYTPDTHGPVKKHAACADCHSCLRCSDDKCSLCLQERCRCKGSAEESAREKAP